jgi:hypothetical protein
LADPNLVEILHGGAEEWNRWRVGHPKVAVDLSGADLYAPKLSGANLYGVILQGANLYHADLSHASFLGADLSAAKFPGADLSGADLSAAKFLRADLSYANLSDVNFLHANLSGANLTGTRLLNAELGWTVLADVDLTQVMDYETSLLTVRHSGPSSIGIDTLYRSEGKIPEAFLRGAGVPDALITYARSLVTAPIEFYSCFISYSHNDEDFARRLYSRLRDDHVRVWYAPEEMKGGQKLHEQIYEALKVHEKLLLVLSENSLNSEWVKTEIRRTRKAEREMGKKKLFPIRLIGWKAIRDWECFDADSGKDLGVEFREYFVPDFTNWKDHDQFEAAYRRLIRDLQAETSVER